MSCGTKKISLDALKEAGAIENNRRIDSFQAFNRLNELYTRTAKDKYGVGTNTEDNMLFSVSWTDVNVSVKKENVKPIARAVPNEELFNQLDEAIDKYNKLNNIGDDNKNEDKSFENKKIHSLVDEKTKPIFGETTGEQSKVPDQILDLDYSHINNFILFDNKSGKFTASEVLENLIKNFSGFSAESKFILDKAVLLLNKTGAKIKFVSPAAFKNDDTFMQYNALDNTILISREKLKDAPEELTAQAFVHEVVHSVTAKAYIAPNTMAEQMFKEFIDEAFTKYKDLANNSDSYGFTNQMEFIAEAFTNKEFQDELKALDANNGKKGFWAEFIDAIRRIFGVQKSQNFSDVFNAITEVVELDYSEFEGLKGSPLIFEKKSKLNKDEKPEMAKIRSIEDKIARANRVATDNLTQALARAKQSRNKSENKEVFIDKLETLIEEMTDYANTKPLEGLGKYLRTLSDTVSMLENIMEKKDFDSLSPKDALEGVDALDNYLATFDMLTDIKKLIAAAKRDKKHTVPKEDIAELEKIIDGFESSHSDLVNDFLAIRKENFIQMIANPKYITQVETDWRIKLQKQYRERKIVSETMTEWVTRQMNETFKDDIQEDLLNYARDMVDTPGFDITKADAWLSDPLNSGGTLLQTTVNIMAQVRDRINERVRDVDFELDALYKKLSKEKGTTNINKMFENILRQDTDGNYYLRGEIKIEFLKDIDKNYKPLKDKQNAIIEEYLSEGKSEADARASVEFKTINKELSKWYKANTIKFADGVAPKNEWLDKKEDLSETEKEVLKAFRTYIRKTDNETNGMNSLIKTRFGAEFFKIPAVTKSDMERLVEGKVAGTVKDKVDELKTVRPDDVEYRKEAVDAKGNTLKRVQVHFRGDLDPSQQSLDLFTMMRLERLNGISYQEKTEVETLADTMLEIARTKEYIKRSPQGTALASFFRKNEPIVTSKEDGTANEYHRIASYLEGFLYDNLHDRVQNIAGLDANKLVQHVNGATAVLGMSANIASGMANMTNGFSQLIIEAMGGDHISFSSLVKAEKKYAADLPQILDDMTNPVKKSFTNQVIQMFDVFGGFNVSDHPFLRDTLLKQYGNMRVLSGLQEGGEHMLQGILAMAVLDNLKVMNKDSKFIDKDGKVVKNEKDAASLLDMLKKDKNGKLVMDEKVAFTNHNLNVNYHEGGKAHISLLIKKKIHDTMGAYDPNFQNQLYRTWLGKLLMMFKRFLIPGLQHRWKGISSSHKNRQDLDEHEKHYNTAMKEYEEGVYTTLVRFFIKGVIPAVKSLQLAHTKAYWNDMSEYERANLKKSTTEIAITASVIPLMALALSALQGGDDDSQLYWFLAYQLRRLDSELSQYRNPAEAWRITTNPIAGTRIFKNILDVVGNILSPWDWDAVNSRDENEFWNDAQKLIPVWVQIDKDWKKSFNFINNQAD